MKKKPKILLCNVFFAPQTIGGATRVIEDSLADLLEHHADRYDFVVFCSNADEGPLYQLAVQPWQGVRVYRVNVPFRERMDWHTQDEQVQQVFAEVLELERPDLVHFHCIQRLGAGIVEAVAAAAVPYIVTVHDAWWISDYQFLVDEQGHIYPEGHPDVFADVPTPPGVNATESRVRRAYLKDLLKRADAVIAVSERFRDIYRANGVPATQALPNGISSSIRWQPKDTRHTDRIVCAHLGGMARHKGYPLFQAALRAYDGDRLEGLVVDLSKEHGYESWTSWNRVPVRIVGRYAQQDMPQLYRQVDVLFAPSLWPESFGLVTREAAACGCWVVASAIGAIGTDIDDGIDGFLVREISVRGIGNVLQRLAADPARFKGSPPAKPRRYSADQARELVALYEGVLARRTTDLRASRAPRDSAPLLGDAGA